MPHNVCIFFHGAHQANFQNQQEVGEVIFKKVAEFERQIEGLNVVFLGNKEITKMNKKYLNHERTTDVITFTYQEQPILADIFVGISRVRKNAKTRRISYQEEFCRVIFHGVLHILGFDDKGKEKRIEMRKQEEAWLLFYKQNKKCFT